MAAAPPGRRRNSSTISDIAAAAAARGKPPSSPMSSAGATEPGAFLPAGPPPPPQEGGPGPTMRRSSVMSTFSATSVRSSRSMSSTGSRRTVQDILDQVEEEVGMGEMEFTQPYSELVKYRRLLSHDLDNETWVDVISRDGKPLRRNVGILRYLGRVKFGDGVWAGIEMYGPPLEGNVNNGSLDGFRYFNCDQGRGIFLKEKWCRRSFIQRAPRGAGAPGLPGSSANGKTGDGRRQSLSGVFKLPPSPLDAVGVLDMTMTRPMLKHRSSSVNTGRFRKGLSRGDSTASGGTLNPDLDSDSSSHHSFDSLSSVSEADEEDESLDPRARRRSRRLQGDASANPPPGKDPVTSSFASRGLQRSNTSVLDHRLTSRESPHRRVRSMVATPPPQRAQPPAAGVSVVSNPQPDVDEGVVDSTGEDPVSREVDLYFQSGKRYIEGLVEVPPAWRTGLAFIKAHNLGPVAR